MDRGSDKAVKTIYAEVEPGQTVYDYKVGTFPNHTNPKRKPRAYSIWYNPLWEGCVEYLVMAASGKDAREAAILERKKLIEVES